MPKIARTIRKFDGDLSAQEIRLNVDHAAFAFFFRDDIHEQECLSGFYLRFQGKNAAVDAYSIRFGGVAEWTVVHGPSIDANRYGHLESFAAPMPSRLLRHSASFDNSGLDGSKLDRQFEFSNSTFSGTSLATAQPFELEISIDLRVARANITCRQAKWKFTLQS
jgi:hypothetical protein